MMKLFRQANAACVLVPFGRRQWAILEPYRAGDFDGPRTQSQSLDYARAVVYRRESVLFHAIGAIPGVDSHDVACMIPNSFDMRGRPLVEIWREIVKKHGLAT